MVFLYIYGANHGVSLSVSMMMILIGMDLLMLGDEMAVVNGVVGVIKE